MAEAGRGWQADGERRAGRGVRGGAHTELRRKAGERRRARRVRRREMLCGEGETERGRRRGKREL